MASERKQSADEAGTGPDPRQSRHLMPLKELPRFRIAKGEPDIRRWSVYTSNGREVGVVVDLLVDTRISEAVMVDVDLKDTDRRTMAPLRAAWIDREHKRVILDSAHLTPDDELLLLGRTSPAEELRRAAEPHERAAEEQAREHRLTRDAAASAAARSIPPAPGTEVVVERRVVAADEPSWAAADQIEPPHDAALPADARVPGPGRTLVEEVVVRRRYMDTAELATIEHSETPPVTPPSAPPPPEDRPDARA
jgi:hypothetical protein